MNSQNIFLQWVKPITSHTNYRTRQPKTLYFEDIHSIPDLQKLRTNSIWFYHVYSYEIMDIRTLHNPFYSHLALTIIIRNLAIYSKPSRTGPPTLRLKVYNYLLRGQILKVNQQWKATIIWCMHWSLSNDSFRPLFDRIKYSKLVILKSSINMTHILLYPFSRRLIHTNSIAFYHVYSS